jgi:hypothetical protein
MPSVILYNNIPALCFNITIYLMDIKQTQGMPISLYLQLW